MHIMAGKGSKVYKIGLGCRIGHIKLWDEPNDKLTIIFFPLTVSMNLEVKNNHALDKTQRILELSFLHNLWFGRDAVYYNVNFQLRY